MVKTRSGRSTREHKHTRVASRGGDTKKHYGSSYDATARSVSDDSVGGPAGYEVLTNPALLKYAKELLENRDHKNLLDLAIRVYAKALAECESAATSGELPEPSKQMDIERLYRTILQLMRCGAEHAGAHGDAETYAETMKELAQHGEHLANKHHVLLRDPTKMARQIIRATLYETDQAHPDTRSCKRKGIQWKMNVDREDVVEVTRTRAGGQTFKYVYPTPTQRHTDHLVATTAKVRDHYLKHGTF